MRYSLASLALVALASANPMPQGVTSAIAPEGSPLPGCSENYSGSFEIQVVNVTSSSKRSLVKKQADTALVMTLEGGILKDAKGRTGYIAANQQFQFDGPPQTGAIYTAGWSVCANNSLAIGPNPIFYQCLSGTFYNLYDESTGAQCNQVHIQVVGGASASAPASQTADGQVTASAVASQISDGQVTASAVTQISDGQVQATTGTAVVTQISDGQVQATTAASAPVTQISDGQIQATTGAAPVTQISDGQVQATTGAAPVTQISDGQIQATTGVAPVTQISDGQIQATTGVVSQISDGQIQQATATTSASVVAYTGAAAPTAIRAELFGLAAGVLAVAML